MLTLTAANTFEHSSDAPEVERLLATVRFE
jgi:hypothetical protein